MTSSPAILYTGDGEAMCQCGAVRWWSDATWNVVPCGDEQKHLCASCLRVW